MQWVEFHAEFFFYQNWQEYVADEIGVLSPNQMQVDELYAGEVTSVF